MTLKKKQWGTSLGAISSFVHHIKAIGELKLELQSRNPKFGSKMFFSHVALKFDGWKAKYLFYATSRLVHHFIAIDEFKLELLSGNAQL